MAKTVWKYRMEVGSQTIDMPSGAVVVAAQAVHERHADLEVWAVVDPAMPLEPRQFLVTGTGFPLPEEPLLHRATCPNGLGLVWHLFEVVHL
mgnify:CR=1 FL=1